MTDREKLMRAAARIRAVVRVLKKKHPNYTVEEAMDVATDILIALEKDEAERLETNV